MTTLVAMSRWRTTISAAAVPLVLALAAILAYQNSFSVPFLFDDRASILENPTIRSLWPLTEPLSPPSGHGLTVSGRPLVNLTLAFNYALSGTQVWSYHVFNLAVHVVAALLLFGLIRRTLLRGAPLARGAAPPPSADFATPVAGIAAALWLLHPLHTESVTYIVQRSEALMGMFFLLTLYAFVRAVETPSSARRWYATSVAACLCGMATKEVMVSAPVIVWLYDRTFVAGGFGAAWRIRRGYYVALAGTWLLLFALTLSTGGNRGGTMGFDVGRDWVEYASTQTIAITRYLALALWPHPLVFDYGPVPLRSVTMILPHILFVSLLVIASAAALWRRPTIGFFGAAFFCVLAPTSLVPGQMQTIVEHRTYLPLAALLVPIVVVASTWLGRRAIVGLLLLAVVAGFLTALRNQTYQSEIALWTDTVSRRPQNASAHINLGVALLEAGKVADAITRFERAIQVNPVSAVAHGNLANALLRAGQFERARDEARAALRIDPANIDARINLGLALVALQQPVAAIPEFEAALRLQPGAADAHVHLAQALRSLGQVAAAAGHFRAALELDPGDAETWFDLGNLRAAEGALPEAISHYRRALECDGQHLAARNNLANALLVTGQVDAAITQYEMILQGRPDDASIRENLEHARALRSSPQSRP